MEQILWESVAAPRIYMLLLGIFAAIALVIACAGIYGVSAYAVVRRRQEIGIRLAVGATPGQIVGLILRHGMVLTLIGVGIGVAGSLALTKIIAGFLHGITATDASDVPRGPDALRRCGLPLDLRPRTPRSEDRPHGGVQVRVIPLR